MWNKKILVLTENGGAQVQDKSTRVNDISKTPMDPLKHKKFQNLNSQIELVDINDHCAIHVPYRFSLLKPTK